MALGSYQLISRVIGGKPFGDGESGSHSSTSLPTLTYASISTVSSSATSITSSSSSFANGDLIFMHQSRGTGVGQWEFNRVSTGGGTTTLNLQRSLQYTYTDDSTSCAQIIKVPRYTNFTISGAAGVGEWNENTGGIFVAAVCGVATISGSISASYIGYNGAVAGGGSTGVHSGESSSGPSLAWPTVNGGSAPIGSGGMPGWGGGGGGSASDGGDGSGSYQPGQGGYSSGNAELTNITFGGGGGSGASANEYNGYGGSGGGITILIAKTLTITGSTDSHGVTGENSSNGSGGGGGAGGSILFMCQNATLGSNNMCSGAAGGTGPSNNNGGTGSNGRIALHYSGTYTGSASPTLNTYFNSNLRQKAGMIQMIG